MPGICTYPQAGEAGLHTSICTISGNCLVNGQRYIIVSKDVGFDQGQVIRFGRSIRLSGVQHPAPALICSTYRDKNSVRLSAPFARATHNGKNLTRHPMTELWGLLYAQVKMTNGEDQRNILLARRQMRHLESDHQMKQYNGYCEWTNKEIALLLDEFGLSNSCTLSCLAIELFPNNLRDADPLGADLGYTRILRSSQLEPVSDICCADC